MQTYTAANSSRFHPAVLMRGARPQPATSEASTDQTLARKLCKGEELFTEGDDATYFYEVVSGAIRTSKLLNDGRRQIDAFHLPGDIFGLEAGDTHRFTAEATGDAKVVAHRRCSLATLALRNPTLGNQVMNSIMRNLERAQEHMLLLGRKTAHEKIASFLLDIARRLSAEELFELPMQRTDIADHLGLTIETVSRVLSEFARRNYIAITANSRAMKFCNKTALRQLNA